jgi:hypothetical protein
MTTFAPFYDKKQRYIYISAGYSTIVAHFPLLHPFSFRGVFLKALCGIYFKTQHT